MLTLLGRVLFVVGFFLTLGAPSAQAKPTRGGTACASEHRLATEACLAQLQAGGNAVDAAVTAALVAGVVSPSSSGLGGGGFALAWNAKQQRMTVLDFRETAPKGIDVAAFEKRPFAPGARGKAVGVPGEAKGLFELHRRFGKRSWQEVVLPAQRVAEKGFEVSAHLRTVLRDSAKDLEADAGLRDLYLRPGQKARIKNPKLAETLKKLGALGPAAIYEGDIASDLVAAANKFGGALSLDDLKNYQVIERAPLKITWEGLDIYTMPPPSAGGLMLAQTLKFFAKADLAQEKPESASYQHRLAEVFRASLADRMRTLGDPEAAPIDLSPLLSKEHIDGIRARVSDHATHTILDFAQDEQGTHHLIAADEDGNVVSLTTTINHAFGAKITGELSGIVLNDELDDFTGRSVAKTFGLSESPNRPRPRARPVSSMTPTIVVKDGAAKAALGGSGGMTIATNVTQALLRLIGFGQSPKAVVAARRFYVPTRKETLQLEAGAEAALIQGLAARGEIVGINPFTTSAVQIVTRDGKRYRAAADPRKHGNAQAR